MTSGALLQISNVSKVFGATRALSGVTLDIMPGEIHAVLGQNGAGKSTLVRILDGVYRDFEGDILYRGRQIPHRDMQTFLRGKLGVVHQDFPLVPHLSVAENMYLGELPKARVTKRILWDDLYRKADELLKSLCIKVSPRALVKDLDVGSRQMVSIAHALARNPEILILDEATSTLTDSEVDTIFSILRLLGEKGVGIVFISHRIDEILSLSNRVTVLRDGASMPTSRTGGTNRDELINMMAGRDVAIQFPKRMCCEGGDVLRVENLSGFGFRNCSFRVRGGEILGIAGLVGSGRPEMLKTVFGAEKPTAGKIIVQGRHVSITKPLDAMKEGLYLIPSDRRREGIMPAMSVKDNLVIAMIRNYSRMGWIDGSETSRVAKEYTDRLRIKSTGEDQKIAELSGGNQQKVIISRWLSGKGKVFMFDEPTRGLDVGVKYDVYELMNKIKSGGGAIIMISSELPELLAMSDRIIVMYEGEIVAEMDNDSLGQEAVLAAMMNQHGHYGYRGRKPG
ncbi:MAG: sugar ABC transporter ATP-binding protein [Synergistaceae bacterium]|jgi:ribose transport system ATP-binding protein|nr:sugar ABC transporter ATP-binding protein [Synergistaceae bacterium]